MSASPPPPGYPPIPPPTAQHQVPGAAPGDEPVTGRLRVSPVLTGIAGAVAGAGLTLAIVLPLTLGAGDGSRQAGGGQQANDQPSPMLTDAAEACGSPDGVTIEDDGTTLAFDHRGEDDYSGGDFTGIMCVFTELGMPSRISTHMNQTTSLDGRQTASWDGWEIQWSYHPDRGMDGVVTVLAD
ncbi:MAG TPA: hypothetical protein H9815_10315 [Candidatus Ruania gallistercoris]|uniref:Uncharacterized protein n=1 Tax=Candidatus Ruania gallistercoris TaxID=2838746 RepID=A0A9D2EEW3_9MICO|nr:hypothetical protein [Candidatus Ruania gallistercoris]